MRIFDSTLAPNPKKLRVFLAEKNVSIPYVAVDLISGGARSPEFLQKNPLGGVPVLELDDGTSLTESLTIMEYLDELYPTPPMIGATPIERARTREVERWCELGVLGTVAQIFQHTSPLFAGRLTQVPAAAENARVRLANTLKVVDARIGKSPFVAGQRVSIADCTLFAALEFANVAQVAIDPELAQLARWYAAFKVRPSASA
jgi:glutathione S-transferase